MGRNVPVRANGKRVQREARDRRVAYVQIRVKRETRDVKRAMREATRDDVKPRATGDSHFHVGLSGLWHEPCAACAEGYAR